MEHTQPRINAAIFAGLEAVRQSGATNMLDRPRVIEFAEMMGYEETAEWLRTHPLEYAIGVFHGFAVEEEGGQACAD